MVTGSSGDLTVVNLKQSLPDNLYFYISAPHPCSYLEDQQATTLLVDPEYNMSPEVYSILSKNGFRRSGDIIYTPRCMHCNACKPIRIDVAHFQPNRSQRRNLKMNQDLSVRVVEADVYDEHFQLFNLYIKSRHDDGAMSVDSRQKYGSFFISHRVESQMIEFTLNDRLVAVAVIDTQLDGISAVYTFFDPALESRGLGTFAILWQIEACRSRVLPYLYLGYQINECKKMAYKTAFKPYQLLEHGSWQSYDT